MLRFLAAILFLSSCIPVDEIPTPTPPYNYYIYNTEVSPSEDCELFIATSGYIELEGENNYGTVMDVYYYSDTSYSTLVGTLYNIVIGEDLTVPDTAAYFYIENLSLWLLPRENGYSTICVEIAVADSNVSAEGEHIGCVYVEESL